MKPGKVKGLWPKGCYPQLSRKPPCKRRVPLDRVKGFHFICQEAGFAQSRYLLRVSFGVFDINEHFSQASLYGFHCEMGWLQYGVPMRFNACKASPGG